MDLRDPDSFARAYAEHAPAAATAAAAILAPAGRRADVEDVVHDVFVRVWRDPKGFDPARGPFGAYVRMVARSRALDLLRSGQAAGRATERLATAPLPASADVVVSEAERREARRALLRAMAALPQPQREAIALACWGDLTASEIADRAGLPLGTVKGRLRLGLARMRAELESSEMAAATLLTMISQLL
ncbi:sigma-70 family RNA polymerase sigma factor [Patulibacter sp. SYSU D01012]|uniref:RNA polymerase sigma factor n=1 Tax=Patulibacter sp. SYSU D01012 TaxID=2817381 RepID=UPI001B313FC2|nr:sigma-70 family RNA polymerase sigma factor [Patulibacter sp. SYSU D01012]